MNETNESRICPHCKKDKLLTVGNFKKRSTSTTYSKWCRRCLDSSAANKSRAKRKLLMKNNLTICKYIECDNTFTQQRAGTQYCSRECKRNQYNANLKNKRNKIKETNPGNQPIGINPIFLVRGKISNGIW